MFISFTNGINTLLRGCLFEVKNWFLNLEQVMSQYYQLDCRVKHNKASKVAE